MNRLTTLHRPLMLLAAASVLLTLAAAVGAIVDPREVTGVNVWFKPLKFAISTVFYTVALAWLISLLKRWRRVASIAGLLITVGLVVELVIIVGFAAVGDTSHFNISTPLHTAMWSVMAFSITAVWILTLLIAIALFRNDLGHAARSTAIRAGVVLAVIGMGLAFLMTSPTAEQLDDFQGIAGAHAVGVPDGGEGLPLLGWSTVAGDLRIPHFIGMHALQVLPLFAFGLELLASRVPALTSLVRLRLVRLAVATYVAVLGLVTWQALAGQSIVRPEGPILYAGIAVAVVAVGAAVAAVAVPPRREVSR